jgi:hypothetical protein
MNEVDLYVEHLNDVEKEKIHTVIDYIRTKYPDSAPKTKFPTFKQQYSDYYVAIVERKGYISIHFGKYECAQIVKNNNPKIKTGVGCAKIPHSIVFPIEDITKAIDYCFSGS